MDERNVRRLERVLQEDRTSTVLDITNSFNNVSTVNVCKRTIQRVLHANGLRKRSIRKKMGVRRDNRVRRVHWCRNRLRWTVNNNWKNVIFSDEMKVIVGGDGLIKIWRNKYEANFRNASAIFSSTGVKVFLLWFGGVLHFMVLQL